MDATNDLQDTVTTSDRHQYIWYGRPAVNKENDYTFYDVLDRKYRLYFWRG